MTHYRSEETSRCFEVSAYLPKTVYHSIIDLRIDGPDTIWSEARRRKRRTSLTLDGRLVIVAVDHPGRRVTALPGSPLGMANRHAYLARAVRALSAPGVDGIMGTPDFMEDILLLSHILRETSASTFLDGKVLLGCMNRGGFAGVAGEIDDRFTAFSARQLARLGFEGGKMMYRLDPADPRSIESISDCARAVTQLCRRGLYAFVEPLTVRRGSDGEYEIDKSVGSLTKDAGAAAALGESSVRTWLKLPYASGFETVASATTLPILMLGGPPRESIFPTLREFCAGMAAGPNVRGAMIGRNVTFARSEDPRGVAAAVARIVHNGCGFEEASEIVEAERGNEFDAISSLF